MQHQSEDQIVQKYGSYTAYYRTVAKETGTTPDQVMLEAEKMMNPNMQQNSLSGANAQTPVSQVANGPVAVNPQAVQAQSNTMQQQGMGPSQAQNAAATNPANVQMAKGGSAQLPDPPASGPSLDQKLASYDTSGTPKSIMDTLNRARNEAPSKSPSSAASKDAGLKQFDDALGTVQLEKEGKVYAKGGPVSGDHGELKLKEILQLLATHPAMANRGTPGQGMKSTDMSFGGGVQHNSDPDMKGSTNGKHFDMGTRQGLLSGYAAGGPVEPSAEVQNNDAGASGKAGLLAMSSGGTLESDQIQNYGPDGMPIVQNQDGSSGYGDLNQLLDRPENSSTLGTGADPSVAHQNSAANAPLIGMAMAKGGEDSPPGSLSEETADDIPAKLSAGEFVMSADTTRYFGLKMLTEMQDHARQELAEMHDDGGIRSPGDGKNPDAGQFMQDQQPNDNFYSPDEMGEDDDDAQETTQKARGGPIDYGKAKGGLMRYAAGGDVGKSKPDTSWGDDTAADKMQADHEKRVADTDDKNEATDSEIQNPNQPKKLKKGGLMKMSTGGGTTNEETQFKKGGQVDGMQYGRNNMVSAHPKAGSVHQDYDKGGIVSSKGSDLTPKKVQTSVPTGGIKMPKSPVTRVNGPHADSTSYGLGKFSVKAKKGGLLRDVNATQSYIGS